ncbi:Ku protein [Streptomyces sp. N2A]|uniref:Ku protein n=1 Tax=Streptomyces sp. N2A TaxID=3073936 RepID=UPI0037D9EAF8
MPRHTAGSEPPENGGRIRHRRVCEVEGLEVGPAEVARGWEAPAGRTVVIHDEDLEALPLPTKRVIEVVGFVDETDVDPLLYARPYWVGAHGPGAEKSYARLRRWERAADPVSERCRGAARAAEKLGRARKKSCQACDAWQDSADTPQRRGWLGELRPGL